MSQRIAWMFVVGLFAAWVSLFFISPPARDYLLQSFSASDSAYTVYDDFKLMPNKSLVVFKIFALCVLYLIYRSRSGEWAQSHQCWLMIFHLSGGLCICLWWPSIICVCVILFAIGYAWNDAKAAQSKRIWILAALTALSLLLRLEKIPNVYESPLQPDSSQYVELSQQMTWFYDTQHREPLLAWIDRALSLVFPIPADLSVHGYLPIRLVTVFLSCLVVILVYVFGMQFFSHRAAFLAALLISVNKAFVYRSLQGLREELLILGILTVLALSMKKYETRKWTLAVALGISSGALLLVRTACLPFVIFTFAFAGWRKCRSLRELCIAGLICLILASPYYIYCWKLFGDPMYSGSYHVNKFYYMTVFNTGAPDTSTVPFVTTGHLMFHIFHWYQSLALTIEGTLDTLFGRFALRLFYLPCSVIWIGCSAVGYLLWWKDSLKRWWIVLMLLLLGPMAFILAMLNHSSVVFDWRTVLHLAPFMAYAAADGLFYLLERMDLISPSSVPHG